MKTACFFFCETCRDSALRNVCLRDVHFGHEFPADHCEHFLQLGAFLGGETVGNPVHDLDHVAGGDVVVVDILLGNLQMVFPAVIGRLDLADISLLDQAVDLVGGVGRGDAHEGGKLVDSRAAQRLDGFHAEGFHSRQTGLPVLKAPKDLLVEMQLKFGIHVKKCVFQHSVPPLSGHIPNAVQRSWEKPADYFATFDCFDIGSKLID